MRLMRLERDLVFARARRQRRVSAAAIAMAIGQIRVELKIGPAFGEAHPVRQRAATVKQRPHRVSIDERKSFSLDALRSAIVMLASEAAVAEGVQGSPALQLR